MIRHVLAHAAPLAAAAVLLLPDVSAAQAPDMSALHAAVMNSGRRTMTAERMADDEKIVLDGILDEAVWGRATSAGAFIQQDPVFEGTPTEATDVRIVYNRDHLYIGVVCHDSEPDKLLGNTRKRDEFLSADDRFMWTMDPFLDQQSGYFFEMNPSGLMADALLGAGGTNNREWDGIWNARVRRSEVGWTIEIDIPFRTLNFDPNAPAWGVNFQRTVRRKNEENMWTGYQRNQGLRRMSNAGLLLGIHDVSQGMGLELKPYVSGSVGEAPGRIPATGVKGHGDVGLDVSYNLTPSLRGVATFNTDFAETEVDQRLVNLTRFPLSLPEKRTFFLDGANFFDFYVPAFFSRRIGLDANGQPQRIDVGAKLTGQAGAQDIGALYVRTGEDEGAPAEDFLVARSRRRFFRQSYVGGIFTARAPHGVGAPSGQQTAGADFLLATSEFRGNKNLQASGYVLWNSDELGLGDNLGYAMKLDYPNDRWDATFEFQEIQKNHSPSLGFTPRRDFRKYRPSLRFSPRPQGHPWIRRLSFGGDMNLFTNTANELVTREIDITAFRVEMHSQDSVQFELTPTYERLERNFTISDGITLPIGTAYDFTRYQVQVNTANRRVLAVQGTYGWGSFFSGDRREVILGLGVRPRPGVTINLRSEWNDVDLAEGRFQTRLYRLITDTQFSPFMYIVNNIQYDSVSRVLGWQARYRWTVTPGNDVFVVYTHNWLDALDGTDPLDPSLRGFRTLDRRAAAKVVYTKRF
ncbi:MAG: DUF5916 domain-containing protein [Vicinamibacterales bacterium]